MMVKHRRFMDAVFEHIRLNGAKTVADLVYDVEIVVTNNRRTKRHYLNAPSKGQLTRLITMDSRFVQVRQGNKASLWTVDDKYLQEEEE